MKTLGIVLIALSILIVVGWCVVLVINDYRVIKKGKEDIQDKDTFINRLNPIVIFAVLFAIACLGCFLFSR